MKDAGYATMIAGKWQLNGRRYKWPRYDDNTRPYDAGFDEYCLKAMTTSYVVQNGKVLGDELKGKYMPDVFCDYVCDFIRRKKDGPFLVYYPMGLVHYPFVPTPDTADRQQSQLKNFGDMVAYADKIVGRIYDTLKEEGLLDNTMLLFTADNGTDLRITSETRDGKVKGGKGKTTDAGTHVPLVAYWKGHTPVGATSSDLIDFTDFLPTLAEAAGATLPDDGTLDGRSFLPQLRDEKGNPREWIFCHYDPLWGKASRGKTRFARTQRFKLYHDGRFYDLSVDVLEKEEIDLAKGNEVKLKQSVRDRLQAVLDSKPPWAPRTRPKRWTRRNKS
jgi:arylsulfatase A-like enzyme